MNLRVRASVFIALSICLLALVILILSFSTIYWNETQGTIQSFHERLVKHKGGYPGIPYSQDAISGEFTFRSIEYQYEVDDKNYNNTNFCICLPIGIKHKTNYDGTIKVYYWKRYSFYS